MPLGAPSIVGPVSTCSDRVQVRGQFSGSTVRIFILGNAIPIAKQVVGFSDVAISIDRSRLSPGQKLIATQQLGDETSRQSGAKPEDVEAAVNGQVIFGSALHVCGRSVELFECSPGATLTLLQGTNLLGETTALRELAQIIFRPGRKISAGIALRVRQKICSNPTLVDTLSDIPIQPPIGPSRVLPKPIFERPVKACHRLVTIRKIIPGAIVRIFRGGHKIFEQAHPSDVLQVVVDALEEGESLAVDQIMPECEIRESEQDRLKADPVRPVGRPRVDGPLCAGLGQVIVSRLEPGATVRIFADDQEIGRWEAWDRTCPFDLKTPIPPAVITAQQELCGVKSELSRRYTAASGRSGRWFVVEDANGEDLKAEAFAIHAALLRTGKIVLFSGSQHDFFQGRPKANPPAIDHTQVFDCGTLQVSKMGPSPHFDAFCSGHALLPDGRLLVAGGTEFYKLDTIGEFHIDHFPGLSSAAIFDPMPSFKPWINPGDMPGGGRWYPTLVTLASGDVLVLSGHPDDADKTRHNNNTMLLHRPTASTPWHIIGDSLQITSGFGYLYPRLHVLPSGDVFSSTPVLSEQSARWTPGVRTPEDRAKWRDVDRAPDGYGAYDFTSVLLPLLPEDDYRAQVAIVGAGEAPLDPPDEPAPTPRGDPQGHIIDFGTLAQPNSSPRWNKIGPRATPANNRRRLNLSAVILPTAEVFVCGGVVSRGAVGPVGHKRDNAPVFDPEMLVRRATGAWAWSKVRLAKSSIPRNYHSTALLMPDGRVWTAGSNIGGLPGGPTFRHLEVEIYEPWYMCRERPIIRGLPEEVEAGGRIPVRVKSKRKITRLAIVRCGSSTHAFNGDQRYVGLADVRQDGDLCVGILPRNGTAVPGYYLLFAITDEGVPSVGKFIRVR